MRGAKPATWRSRLGSGRSSYRRNPKRRDRAELARAVTQTTTDDDRDSRGAATVARLIGSIWESESKGDRHS